MDLAGGSVFSLTGGDSIFVEKGHVLAVVRTGLPTSGYTLTLQAAGAAPPVKLEFT